MRESIGGTWLLSFVVLFIVLFSGFLAVSINYTKAFQTKNTIIKIIEANEGLTETAKKSISETLRNNGYYMSDDTQIKNKCDEKYKEIFGGRYSHNKPYNDGGYCAYRIKSSNPNNGSYYKVTTFIKIELPLIWNSFLIPISGETKPIYYDQGR